MPKAPLTPESYSLTTGCGNIYLTVPSLCLTNALPSHHHWLPISSTAHYTAERLVSRTLRFQAPCFIESLSTNAPLDNWIDENQNANSFESADEFERRIFGGYSGGNSRSESFYQKLEKLTKGRNTFGSRHGEGDGFQAMDDLDGNFNTLSHGMDEKLQRAAQYFEVDDEEVSREDYSFRPDAYFPVGSTYDIKDLDLTKPGVRMAERENCFEVTTEEVLRKADFRNVRFLAKFMTEAGLIIKRSQTDISAKAQ